MLSPTERAWIADHPRITYTAEPDNYPWSYRDASGTARGYGVDLLKAIAQSTGLQFEPVWVSNPRQANTLIGQQQA
ncbi:transporter substrate-binding domain-containing protein, partial [Variovorax sp. 2RAF20]